MLFIIIIIVSFQPPNKWWVHFPPITSPQSAKAICLFQHFHFLNQFFPLAHSGLFGAHFFGHLILYCLGDIMCRRGKIVKERASILWLLRVNYYLILINLDKAFFKKI
jgi:hypothetical protein